MLHEVPRHGYCFRVGDSASETSTTIRHRMSGRRDMLSHRNASSIMFMPNWKLFVSRLMPLPPANVSHGLLCFSAGDDVHALDDGIDLMPSLRAFCFL